MVIVVGEEEETVTVVVCICTEEGQAHESNKLMPTTSPRTPVVPI